MPGEERKAAENTRPVHRRRRWFRLDRFSLLAGLSVVGWSWTAGRSGDLLMTLGALSIAALMIGLVSFEVHRRSRDNMRAHLTQLRHRRAAARRAAAAVPLQHDASGTSSSGENQDPAPVSQTANTDEDARVELARLKARETAREAELEELAQALAAQKALAEAAQRTAGEFLATMSHEFRTPLNAIIGFADMMIAELHGPLGAARYRAYAQDISASGLRLLQLIADLLDMTDTPAADQKPDFAPIDLEQILGDCISLIGPRSAAAGVTLDSEIGFLPRLYADARAIKQAVLHMIIHGLGWAARDGRLTLSAEADLKRVTFTIAVEVDPAAGPAADGASQLPAGLALAERNIAAHGGKLHLRAEESLCLIEATLPRRHLAADDQSAA